MRLWSLDHSILDRQGLGGAWREGLLAQSVIVRLKKGEKPGYRNHPQLARFLATDDPLATIGTLLSSIRKEALNRGYSYDLSKILAPNSRISLTVTQGQIKFEHEHILSKLKSRSPEWYEKFRESTPCPGEMFIVTPGGIEKWEKQ